MDSHFPDQWNQSHFPGVKPAPTALEAGGPTLDHQDVPTAILTQASLVTLCWRICLLMQGMQEMRAQPLSREDPLEKEMTAHFSILA